MAPSNRQRSLPDIMSDLLVQMSTLFSKETQLVRAEVSENVASVGRGLAMIVGGAVLLIPALVILLQAAVSALTDHAQLEPYVSALIVGGIALILGIVLLLIGVSQLKAENLLPNRTVRQLRRDAHVVKQQVGSENDRSRAA